MDFNTQRKIVKSLKEKGKNPLLFIPCLIARLAVVAFMSAWRAVDMALSDKNGNFLGIKAHKSKHKRSFDKELSALEKRVNSAEDDFSEKEKKRISGRLPYRNPLTRAVSFCLAFAFAFMVIPDIGIRAAAASDFTVSNMETINAENIPTGISELDLYTNYFSDMETYPLNLASGAVSGRPELTTIKMPALSDTQSIAAGNFVNLAPTATVFVRTDDESAYRTTCSKIGDAVNTVWDKEGKAYELIPKSFSSLTATGGAGGVVLTWDYTGNAAVANGTEPDDPDGYLIYSYNNGSFGNAPIEVSVNECRFTEGPCRYTISNASGESVYAIIPYNDIELDYDILTGKTRIYGKSFAMSAAVTAKKITTEKPAITASANNMTASVQIKLPVKNDLPSYVVLFSKNIAVSGTGTTDYKAIAMIEPQKFKDGVFTFYDTESYDGSAIRAYTAAVYYDAQGKNNNLPLSSFTFPEEESSVEYTVVRSNESRISTNDVKLNPPTNLTVTAVNGGWMLDWAIPENPTGLKLRYSIKVDNREVTSVTDKSATDAGRVTTAMLPNSLVTAGKNFTVSVSVTAENAPNMKESDPVKKLVNVEAESVKIAQPQVYNGKIVGTFESFSGATYYTVYYSYKNENNRVVENYQIVDGDKTSYELTDLKNNVEYTVWIVPSNSDLPSQMMTVWVNNAPPAPSKFISIKPDDRSAEITWAIAYDSQGNPVTGYELTVKEKAGAIAYKPKLLEGKNSENVTGLENGVAYYAEVRSYIIDDEGEKNFSEVLASQEFVPMPTAVPTLTVTPSGKTIKLTWSSVKNAKKYIVVRTGGEKEMKWAVTGKSFIDDNVNNGVYYTYSVAAVREIGGEEVTGNFSEAVTERINYALSPVQGLKAKGSDTSVKLTWDKVQNADGYYVERRDSETGSWQRIAIESKNNFTDENIVSGREYDYRVIPYVLINGTEYSYSENAQISHAKTGEHLDAPTDFTVTASDNSTSLSWKAVPGADGYEIYVVGPDSKLYLLDRVSKTKAEHLNIPVGTTITYTVCAYKYIEDTIIPGDYTVYKSVKVGVELEAPTDLAAKPGDSQVSLSWKKTAGADGYVVYCYNAAGLSFSPVGIVTSTSYQHTGLTNGRTYTYMVAAYKNVGNKPEYSEYSMSVSAIPVGAQGNVDSTEGTSDHRINITGTTPYGMSNSNYISAFASKGAVNSDIDVRFTLSDATAAAVENVLNFYGEGIESFLVYPMDISLYHADTDMPATLNDGYYMTLTIPVPDSLLPFASSISVVHVSDHGQLEILPAVHVDVNGVDCMQFEATSFSPYAFVVYLPDFMENTGSGGASAAQGSVEYQSTASMTLMCTYLPDIYRRRIRNKTFRIKK